MESRQPLRLWPGVLAVVLQWLVRYAVPAVVPGSILVAMLGGLTGAVAIAVWWLFFSRAPWVERLGAPALMVVAAFATVPLLHESISGGMMGMLFTIYLVPVLCLALVAGAMVSRHRSDGFRRVSIAGAVLLGCGTFTLLQTGGMTGEAKSDFHWRWTDTPEERLLARTDDNPVPPPAAAPGSSSESSLPTTPAAVPTSQPPATGRPVEQPPIPAPAAPETAVDGEWPGFRGPRRDGIVRGVRFETDWSASPPTELWRRPIGPGWSSFAVRGGLVYTQEQRGDDEVVSAYSLTTGDPVWRHRDAVRFWESNAGAGPRATPTVDGGRVYTFGATGVVNALDADTGAAIWSRNAADDTGVGVPGWGFAGSPLVLGDLVIVAASGRLVAYDRATGSPRWLGPSGRWGYSSPHRLTLDGVTQVVLLNGGGATSVSAEGTVLWEHQWRGGNIVQPALTADGDLLIGAIDEGASGVGVRRVAVTRRADGWHADERWTTNGLKPSFNDYVVHNGHAFGFDGSILASIDLRDGTRAWKGGRYGHGQLVLIADQDLLLVLSEEGALALVRAIPDRFAEVARVRALDGKTWNHPALVGDIVIVRNGEEMAAFRLARAR